MGSDKSRSILLATQTLLLCSDGRFAMHAYLQHLIRRPSQTVGTKVHARYALISSRYEVRCLIFALSITKTSQKTALREPPSLLAQRTPTFSDHDVVFLNHARDAYRWAAHESVILNLLIEGVFAGYMERARYHPFDVVCQARQDSRMVTLGESVHVLLHCSLIWAHGFSKSYSNFVAEVCADHSMIDSRINYTEAGAA